MHKKPPPIRVGILARWNGQVSWLRFISIATSSHPALNHIFECRTVTS